MSIGPEERDLFLSLVRDLKTTFTELRNVARLHGAVRALLIAKGLVTREEYADAVVAHETACEVEAALDPGELERRLRRLEEWQRRLEEGPS